MSKKKLTLLASIFTIAALLLLIIFLSIPRNVSSRNENPSPPPQNNPVPQNNPEQPKGPLFTVPENILGTLGIISALAVAFITYAFIKKPFTTKIS